MRFKHRVVELKIFRCWSRSLKFAFRFNGHSLCGKRVVPLLQCFLVSMKQIVLEQEPKILDVEAGVENFSSGSTSLILQQV